MAERFTLDEFKNYIQSQDSLGDVLYNLSENNVKEANIPFTSELVEEPEYESYWHSNKNKIVEVVDSNNEEIGLLKCESFEQISMETALDYANECLLFELKDHFKN